MENYTIETKYVGHSYVCHHIKFTRDILILLLIVLFLANYLLDTTKKILIIEEVSLVKT